MIDEEERGQSTPVGGRPVDENATGNPAEAGGESERVDGGMEMMGARDQSRKGDVMKQEEEDNEDEEEKCGFVKIEKTTRTDTERTLVACIDDDNDGGDDDDTDEKGTSVACIDDDDDDDDDDEGDDGHTDEKGKFELGISLG